MSPDLTRRSARQRVSLALFGFAAVSSLAVGPRAASTIPAPVLAELRAELEHRPFWLARWEQTCAAAALEKATDPDAELRPGLRASLRDGTRSPTERVAAAELLWRLSDLAGDERPALESAELGFLRSTAHGGLPGSGLSIAARRALLELGDWSDELALVRALAVSRSVSEQSELVRCASALRTPSVLLDLAHLMLPDRTRPASSRLPALAAAALSSAVAGLASDDPQLRGELAQAALDAIDVPFAPPELVARACGVLGRLGGPHALARLARLCREGSEPAARALARSGEGRATLVELIADPLLSEPGRLVAAAALAGPEASPADRALAGEVLARIAARGLESGIRLRAQLALELLER